MKIAEGIHKVDGIRVGNVYIVETDEGLMAVDTGTPGNARHILRCVEALGRRPEALTVIVLTHWHVDHVGSAAELKRLTGAKVAVHPFDATIVAGGDLPPKGRRVMGLIVRLLRVRAVVADLLLAGGSEIGGFRVIDVPGHTAGSIALVKDGIAFTGDALRGNRHGAVLPPDPSLSLDPEQAMASAARLRGFPLRLVLPGHGLPAVLGPEV
jgi:hydroxyacylglutathione hydrolase